MYLFFLEMVLDKHGTYIICHVSKAPYPVLRVEVMISPVRVPVGECTTPAGLGYVIIKVDIYTMPHTG